MGVKKMNQIDKSPMSDSTYAEALRRILDRIHHEDTLIDRRFSWLLTSQAIFLSLYEIVVKLDSSSNSCPTPCPSVCSSPSPVFGLIPPFALIICLLNYLSLLAALFAIYDFCQQLNKQFPQHILFSKQNILGPTLTHVMGQASAFFLPLGFVGIWLIILVDVQWSVAILSIWLLILVILWGRTFPYPSHLIPVRRARKTKR
jgi:hypothetical protein